MNTVCFLCGSLFNPNLQWRCRSGVIKVQSGKGAEPRPLLLGSLSRAFFFFFWQCFFLSLACWPARVRSRERGLVKVSGGWTQVLEEVRVLC